MYNLRRCNASIWIKRESTADIDIKVSKDYFEELQTRFVFKKSPKYEYLYEISDDIEVAVQDYDM